jgi:hypothetical protein
MDLSYPPEYLQHLYEQIASIAAVLGGFSITTLAVLLTATPDRSIASWAAAVSGIAAGLLTGTTFLASILASDALKTNATTFSGLTPSIQPLVGIVSLSFLIGFYMLLISLGMAGWIRSRRTGIATTLAATVGALLVTLGYLATT